jgi:gliding motility-associated-like protein
MGDTRTLDAGNFAAYQWQDGSTGRSIEVKSIGQYIVQVTDNNGCKGNDTTVIKRLLLLPHAFLPADTAICSYGTVEIKPLVNTYRSFLWSSGAVSPSITVAQPGSYWLQVRDKNNCIGKDTVVVYPKECMKGLYVPTAFSPNGDGRNDLFRPLLFGNLKHFQFTVYNRWGKIIFQSSDLQKGWNGKVNGILQETGVFVWTCTYEFVGGVVTNEKGTVTVIK